MIPPRRSATDAKRGVGTRRGAALRPAISTGRLPSPAARRGGARRHPFTSLAPPTGAPLMRLAIKRRAIGGGRGHPQAEPGGKAPQTQPGRSDAGCGPWRKRGRSGATRCSSCSPASPTPWAWATCGASPTCARCTAEVSARAPRPRRSLSASGPARPAVRAPGVRAGMDTAACKTPRIRVPASLPDTPPAPARAAAPGRPSQARAVEARVAALLSKGGGQVALA